MAYILPHMEVHQIDTGTSVAGAPAITAFIFGPSYHLVKHNYFEDSDAGKVAYKSSDSTHAAVPLYNFEAGMTLDSVYSALYAFNAVGSVGNLSWTDDPVLNDDGNTIITATGSVTSFAPGMYVIVDDTIHNVLSVDTTSKEVVLEGDLTDDSVTSPLSVLKNFGTVKTNITASSITDSGYTPATSITFTDGSASVALFSGDLFIQYRAKRASVDKSIREATSTEDITTMIGVIDVDNPLAYGVFKALTNSGSSSILFAETAGSSDSDFISVIDSTTLTDSVYQMVPLTVSKTVFQYLANHVVNMSSAENRLWRIGWVSSAVDTTGSAAEIAELVHDESEAYASKRIYNVFPTKVYDNGVEVSGCYLAAAIAGLVSGVLPQQPITNLTVKGFDDIPMLYEKFSRTNLNRMAEGGTFIVMQDRPGAKVYVRHQISTVYSDGVLTTGELSCVKNFDNISYTFSNRLEQYYGKYNVTPELVDTIRSIVTHTLDGLLSSTESGLYGPQILSDGTEIVEIKQDPVRKDTVIVRVNINLPVPMNVLKMYLYV